MNPELGFSIGSTVYPGLSKLIEECGEVIQIAGKLIATGGNPNHWDGSDLWVKIHEELGDLKAAIAFFEQQNDLDWQVISDRAMEKILLFREWHVKQLAAAATNKSE